MSNGSVTTVATRTVSSGNYAQGTSIALSSDGCCAYVTLNILGSGPETGNLLEILLSNGSATTVATFSDSLAGLALSIDGSYAYVASSSSSTPTLFKVLLSNGNVATVATFSTHLASVALSADGHYPYVTSNYGDYTYLFAVSLFSTSSTGVTSSSSSIRRVSSYSVHLFKIRHQHILIHLFRYVIYIIL